MFFHLTIKLNQDIFVQSRRQKSIAKNTVSIHTVAHSINSSAAVKQKQH